MSSDSPNAGANRKEIRPEKKERKADKNTSKSSTGLNSSKTLLNDTKEPKVKAKNEKTLAEIQSLGMDAKKGNKFVKIDLPKDPDREKIYKFFDNTKSEEFSNANATNMFLTTAQIIALESIYESTIRYGWHLNSSPTGSGKTVMTLALIKALGIKYNKPVKIVTVLPATLMKKGGGSSTPWIRECKIYHELNNLIQVSIETVRHKKFIAETTEDNPKYVETSFAKNTLPNEKAAAKNDPSRKTVFTLEKNGSGFTWFNNREKEVYGSNEKSLSESNSKSSSESSSEDKDPGDGYQFGVAGMIAAKMEKYERETTETVVVYKKGKGGKNIKTNTEVKKIAYDYNFFITPGVEWMQFCVNNIVLLVIDEAHSGKNVTSGQNQAIAALIRGVRRARAIRKDKASFFAFLTATPMEKKQHAISYMKMIGYTNPLNPPGNEKLDMTIDGSKRRAFPCYLEAKEYNEKKAHKIALSSGIITNKRGIEALNKNKSKENKVTAKDQISIIYQLWSKCILPKTHVAVLSDSNRELFNAFIDITIEENRKHIVKANNLLEQANEILQRKAQKEEEDNYNFDMETDDEESSEESSEKNKKKRAKSEDDDKLKPKKQKKGELLALFGESRRMVEEAMVYDMVRFSIKIMSEYPNDRVLLGFTAIDSVDIARHYFEEESIPTGRVAGPTSNKKKGTQYGSTLPKPDGLISFEKRDADRHKLTDIEKFLKKDIKVLVATLQSIATGKDLHDIIYREPNTPGYRVWSLMPGDYNLTMEQQFAGRTARIGSQTIPVIMLMYPKSFGQNIMQVYDAGKAKSAVAKAILSARRNSSAMTPEQKLFKKKLVLPGEYNRYIELPYSSISAIMDKPEYKLNNAKDDIELVIPDFKKKYRFLGTNNAVGRLSYTKVDEVIKFMEEACTLFTQKNKELKKENNIKNKELKKLKKDKVPFEPIPLIVLKEYLEKNGIFTMPIGSSTLNPYPATDKESRSRLFYPKSNDDTESEESSSN